jgi:hypothetical protein
MSVIRLRNIFGNRWPKFVTSILAAEETARPWAVKKEEKNDRRK